MEPRLAEFLEFEWDEANQEHVRAHGFEPEMLADVLERRYGVLRNKRFGAGQYKLVGRTIDGSLVTIVVAPTLTNGLWRPITAWSSTQGERTYAAEAGI
jgi:uncharacterized DUF497 family protein